MENLDHGKNFQIAPTGEHSTHLPEGAGGLITLFTNGTPPERSKATEMISASRSTIQDPAISKNVFFQKTMREIEKEEYQNS